MKIRIKVKHLVLLAASVLVFFTLLFTVLLPRAELNTALRQLNAGNPAGTNTVLNLINASSTSSKKKWELIRKTILENTPDTLAHAFEVYIGPDSTWSTGSTKTTIDWEQRLPYLEDYVAHGPTNDLYLARAAKQLAFYYNSEGQVDQAVKALETAEQRLRNSKSPSQWQDLLLMRANLYVTNDDYASAEALLDQIQEEQLGGSDFDWNGKIALLRGELLLRKGEPQEALRVLDEELAASIKTRSNLAKTFDGKDEQVGPVIVEQLTTMKKRIALSLQHKNGSRFPLRRIWYSQTK